LHNPIPVLEEHIAQTLMARTSAKYKDYTSRPSGVASKDGYGQSSAPSTQKVPCGLMMSLVRVAMPLRATAS